MLSSSRLRQEAPDLALAWQVCLTAAGCRRRGERRETVMSVDGQGLSWSPAAGSHLDGNWSEEARELVELYRPLLDLRPDQRYLIGHLGQSLDGRIATETGDARYINGQENLIHIHRLRALCDAVLVGAGTVVADDPQLTTRLATGPDPVRVVLDPSARVNANHRLCVDSRAQTLLVRQTEAQCGHAEILRVPVGAHGLDLSALLDTLAARGLRALLIEGGGITVSRFLAAGLLDRLQITIAPIIIGSGRMGLQLAEVATLADCLRPPSRQWSMGSDRLWDMDLRR